MDINLRSPFLLTQALLPKLRAGGSTEDPARIINVGSIDGLHVSPVSAYSYAQQGGSASPDPRAGQGARTTGHHRERIAPGPFESKMMAATLDAMGEAIAEAAPLRRIGRIDE